MRLLHWLREDNWFHARWLGCLVGLIAGGLFEPRVDLLKGEHTGPPTDKPGQVVPHDPGQHEPNGEVCDPKAQECHK